MTPTKLGKSVPNRLVMICGEATSPAVQVGCAHPPTLPATPQPSTRWHGRMVLFAWRCGSRRRLLRCLGPCIRAASPAVLNTPCAAAYPPASPDAQASLNMLAGNGVSAPPLIGVGSTAQQVLDVKTAVQVRARGLVCGQGAMLHRLAASQAVNMQGRQQWG